ncbi:hypothetical protein ACIBL3_04605 [Kribbella sp. NPDC050124]|uniref:hypothetical protein n=1 Tax=Kribbella sp. NPDC050124 TaxID=3364114 RepID=UPI0037B64C59
MRDPRLGTTHEVELSEAQKYADQLGATLHTVPDSYTYVSEDQPELTAKALLS